MRTGDSKMRLHEKKEIIPPEGGWKESTYYIVEVSFSRTNPVHRKIFYSGFLIEGFPAGYNQLFAGRDTGFVTIKNVFYLKALKEIEYHESMPNP